MTLSALWGKRGKGAWGGEKEGEKKEGEGILELGGGFLVTTIENLGTNPTNICPGENLGGIVCWDA